jgi:hypothetical protein
VGEAGGRVARMGPVTETVLGLVAAPAPTNHPRLGGQVLGLRSAGERRGKVYRELLVKKNAHQPAE